MRVLVVDDEKLLVKGIKFNLENDGYEVETAYDGVEAVEKVRSQNIDLVIMDLMMPKMNGLDACMEIRTFSKVPIIMLTARSEDTDKIIGFEYGADDYVTKPFSPTILVKKVEALLRRTKSAAYLGGEKDLTFNHEAHEVRLNGQEIELTLKEYNILKKLLENPGRVYSREQLLDSICGYDYVGDIRTVDSHIARLRTKLGDWGNRRLKTVYGIGYKLEEE